jgi:plastocyanin
MLGHFLKKRNTPTLSLQGITPLSLSENALRQETKLTRLYEQGASKKRIRQYRARWLGWALALCTGGANATCTEVGVTYMPSMPPSGQSSTQVSCISSSPYERVRLVSFTVGSWADADVYGTTTDITNVTVAQGGFQNGHTYNFVGEDTSNKWYATLSDKGWTNAGITNPNSLPTLSSTRLTGMTGDVTDVKPFDSVEVADDEGDNVNATIVFTGANGVLKGTGVSGSDGNYAVTKGTVAEVQAYLRSALFTPTPNQVAPGLTVKTTFSITLSDAATGTADSKTVVTVTSFNDAPVITGTPAAAVEEDAAYSFIPTFVDADVSDTKTFSITNKPSWAKFDTTTGALTGTPSNEYVGTTADIVISVTDSLDAVDALPPFSIEVTNTNDAPVITGTPAGAVAEDAAYSFTPIVVDADVSDTKTFSITNKPNWATFTQATGTLTGIPVQADVGTTADIVVSVKDSKGAVDALPPFSIKVTNTNDAPVISGVPAPSVVEGQAYNFTPSASDIDVGDRLTFSIVNMPSWAAFDNQTGKLTGTPANSDIGTSASIIITVKDTASASVSLTAFNIEVKSANSAPIISGAPLTAIGEDAVYSFIPTVVDADVGDTKTFSITNKPSWAMFDTTAGALTGIPVQADVGTTAGIVITVKDSKGAVDALPPFSIEVTNTNDAPIAQDDVIALTFSETGRYVVDVLSNDIDADGDTLTIVNVSSSIGSAIIDDGQLIYTMNGFVDGDIILNYVITDGHVIVDAHVNTDKGEYNGKSKAQATLRFADIADALLPVITLPADIETDATALFTKVNLGVATAIDRHGKQVPVSLVDGINRFKPGNHLVYWQAQDSDGFKRIATQRVAVKPLVTIAKDSQGSEEGHYRVGVYLNGESPSYPVSIDYSVAGDASDDTHNLVPDTVVIESGVMGYIEFDTFSNVNVEADKSLVITLDDAVNLGAKSVYKLTLTQDNIAPQASVIVMQSNERRTLIDKSAGEVVISASVSDANNGDSHTYLWESISGELIDNNANYDDTAFTFDPTNLAVGQQQLTLTVTDDGSIPSSAPLNTKVFVYLDVVDALPTLTDADTDGDLIPDNVEGYSDADNDGIPDYLDGNNTQCNVIPENTKSADKHLAESESDTCLRRGLNTANGGSGSILLAADEVNVDDYATNIGGLFDFVLSGLPVAGQSASVVLPQRLPIPANAIYRKLMPSAGWVEFVVDSKNYYSSTAGESGFCPSPNDSRWTTGLTVDHWCVQVTIEDGGPNDDDGVANNQIVDPGGVAIWTSSNALPTVLSEQLTTTQNKLVVIDVLANDTDSDGDTLTIMSANVDFGSVAIVAGQLHYQPQANFFGMATINYGVSDGNNGTGYGEVSVNVVENTAPVTVDDNASTDDRSVITMDVLSNDSDVDNDTLTLTNASAINGQVTISNNTLIYTPLSGFDGVDTVTYIVDDNNGGQSEGEVIVTINAYETITITNESSGGSVGGICLLMSGVMVFMRRKRAALKRTVSKRNALSVVTKKVFTACVSVLALCGLSVGSQAADFSDLDLFAQVQLGQSNVEQSNFTRKVPVGVVTQVDDKANSWSVGVGVNMSPNWSLSLNYIDMGDGALTITGDTLAANEYHQSVANVAPVFVQGIGVDARYHFLQDEHYNITALVGALVWESEVDSHFGAQRLTQKDDGLDGYYGIEGAYKFNATWSLSLGIKRYILDVNTIDTAYVGLSYQF